MALVKEAIVRLKTDGFTEAESAARGVGKAVAGIKGKTSGASGATEGFIARTKQGLGRLQRAWRGLAATIQGTIVVLGTAAAAGAGLFALGRRGDVFKGVAEAFQNTSGGAQQAAARLAALEGATGGVISKFELMKGANQLTIAQLGISDDQLARTANATVKLARALGFDATNSFDRLTDALAKGETELLDELGLLSEITKAVQDYAKANNVSVGSISRQTRAQIFALTIAEQAEDRARTLGVSTELTAKASESAATQIANMTDKMSEFVADHPSIVRALEKIALAALQIADAILPVIAAIAEHPTIAALLGGTLAGGATGGVITAGNPLGIAAGAGLGLVTTGGLLIAGELGLGGSQPVARPVRTARDDPARLPTLQAARATIPEAVAIPGTLNGN